MNKVIIKILIIFLLLVVTFSIITKNTNEYEDNIDFNSVIQLRKLKLFIYYINNNNFEASYELLSNETKNNKFKTANELENFIKNTYINEEKCEKEVIFEYKNGSVEKDLKEYILYFSVKNIEDYMNALNSDYENIQFYSLNQLQCDIYLDDDNMYKIDITEISNEKEESLRAEE